MQHHSVKDCASAALLGGAAVIGLITLVWQKKPPGSPLVH